MNASTMLTYTGRKVDLRAIDPEQIRIADIAHSHASMCRYYGHSIWYTDAHHAILVSMLAGRGGAPEDGLGPMIDARAAAWALLHDASEAYVGDVIRPLKHGCDLRDYQEIEGRAAGAVRARFGFPDDAFEHSTVKRAHRLVYLWEQRDVRCIQTHQDTYGLPRIEPVGVFEARERFVLLASSLGLCDYVEETHELQHADTAHRIFTDRLRSVP